MIKARIRPRKTVASRVASPARLRRVASRAASSQIVLGRLVAWDDKGPLVDFDGNPRGPVRARATTTGARLQSKAPNAAGQEIVLLVDSRSGRPPILLGFLQPLAGGASELEARVDGRRVELEGRDEIVLRCGEASITLRRNGRIVIKGIQVETRAAGVNRIKGGSVSIN
jgi:Domain of unknown function (DUF6484)